MLIRICYFFIFINLCYSQQSSFSIQSDKPSDISEKLQYLRKNPHKYDSLMNTINLETLPDSLKKILQHLGSSLHNNVEKKVCPVPYSVLLDIDSNLAAKLLNTDSLIEVSTEEAIKILQKICYTDYYGVEYYCSEYCDNINVPRSLFPRETWAKWISSFEKVNTFPSTADTLYEYKNCETNSFLFVEPSIDIIDACSLHFSSKKTANGEQIILINDTPYYIAKRKNGSSVLRKKD